MIANISWVQPGRSLFGWLFCAYACLLFLRSNNCALHNSVQLNVDSDVSRYLCGCNDWLLVRCSDNGVRSRHGGRCRRHARVSVRRVISTLVAQCALWHYTLICTSNTTITVPAVTNTTASRPNGRSNGYRRSVDGADIWRSRKTVTAMTIKIVVSWF